MSKKTIFDNNKYLKEQAAEIRRRIKQFDNKLYLEFGGKLLFDYHAARVLPGYDPNIKIRLLQELKDQAEVLICIYAGDIERKKIRADFGITYETDILKIIDDLKNWGVFVRGVIITRFENQPSAVIFKKKLERRNINVYTHYFTKGYPTDVDLIVSDEGYGANDYIKTEKPLVIVTGPGPGSGKMATCLSQLFHDHRHGIQAGYAKFETFPVWNLPLKHPVNVAYEAATADLADTNIIDPFHLEAYQVQSVNYNRDVGVFPVLQRILEKITGDKSCYQSPTDMGVNRVGFAIFDDEGVRKASLQELIRRFLRYRCEYTLGLTGWETVQRVELLMKEFNVCTADRAVVPSAKQAAEEAIEDPRLGSDGIYVGAAIELPDGTIITGTNSPRMHAAASVIARAIKYLAGIPNKIQLMPENICDSVGNCVDTMTSSREALAWFEKNPDQYDLLITDYTMPEMIGNQLVEKIHALRPQLPVIMCTGVELSSVISKTTCISKILMKPFDMEELIKTNRGVLAKSKGVSPCLDAYEKEPVYH